MRETNTSGGLLDMSCHLMTHTVHIEDRKPGQKGERKTKREGRREGGKTKREGGRERERERERERVSY